MMGTQRRPKYLYDPPPHPSAATPATQPADKRAVARTRNNTLKYFKAIIKFKITRLNINTKIC